MSGTRGTVHPGASAPQWLDWTLRLVALLVVGAAAWSLRGSADAISDLVRRMPVPALLLALAAAVVHALALAACWISLLPPSRSDRDRWGELRAFVAGWIARYAPGKVWAYGIRLSIARRAGITLATGLGTSLAEYAATLAAASLIAVPYAASRGSRLVLALLAAVAVVGILAVPLLLRRGEARVPEAPPAALTPLLARGVRAVILAIVSIVAMGCMNVVLLRGAGMLPAGAAVEVVSASALAWLLGAVAFVAPAGIGVRELALIDLLQPAISADSAAGIAVLTRTLTIVADGVLALLLLAPARR